LFVAPSGLIKKLILTVIIDFGNNQITADFMHYYYETSLFYGLLVKNYEMLDAITHGKFDRWLMVNS